MISDFQDAFDNLQHYNPFMAARSSPAAPVRGTFTEHRFTESGDSRAYKVYVPIGGEAGVALPLLIMLHGCTQSPDDFAAGTRMNDWAERDGFLVCYPVQGASANRQRCWNWFNVENQSRGSGEPALIGGITREVMRRHAVDGNRVYVAGFSAGGAMAVTMGRCYPDIYAAVGVHSGIACGVAHDVNSAVLAMRQGATPPAVVPGAVLVPTIVFHGERDATVHPANAETVAIQAIDDTRVETVVATGMVPGGHDYRQVRFLDQEGRALVERWSIPDVGHAWSGGDTAGSFADPKGPDASGEMLRFFAEHIGVAAAPTC